jgi:[lysine-biosynthesis-protein LysW]---L-2-aminoadipate ligase
MPGRAWIVAGRPTPTNELLVGALHERGTPAEIVRPAQATIFTRPGDVVVGRLDVRPTLDGVEDGLDDLRALQGRGTVVLNPAASLLACHDKLATTIRLACFGVPQPPTAHIETQKDLPPLSFPLVFKPRFGSCGRDLLLCHSELELRRCLRRLRRKAWFRRQGAIVQTLVGPGGYDLRVIVADGLVVGAICRTAAEGEWRTSVSRGGTRSPVEPTPAACVLATTAAAAVGADIVGVDLVPDPHGGFVVLEVNGAVDFNRHYSLPGSEIFDEVARIVEQAATERAAS